MKARLAIVMFMQLFGLGAFFPILSHYLLNVLHFNGWQTGAIFSVSSLVAVVSPLVFALLADRIVRAQTLFSVCHVLGGLCIWGLAYERRFLPFFLMYTLYNVLYGPTLTLAQALVFHHLEERRDRFAGIRVWGTIGWIAVAWLFGWGWLRNGGMLAEERLGDAFIVAACCSFFLAVYGQTLPKTALRRPEKRSLLPRESIRVICSPSIAAVLALGFFASFLDRYFYFGCGPYLRALGVGEAWILPAMSVAQVPEVIGMMMLGWFMRRYGPRKAVLVGLMMQVFRFALFAFAPGLGFAVLGIACHGFGYALFFTTVAIYLDRHCDAASRAGAHLIFSMLSGGLATLLSSLTAGQLLDAFSDRYAYFWGVPLFVALTALAAGMRWFPNEQRRARISTVDTAG